MARMAFVLALFASLLPCELAIASASEADRLLKQAESTLASLPSLPVDIRATISDQRAGRNPLTIYGATARLARPNLARIDYHVAVYYGSPKSDGTALEAHTGTLAANGKSLWNLDLQSNQCRKDSLCADGHEISIGNAFPLDAPIQAFFCGHIPYIKTPPADLGRQIWIGKPYHVIEFRQPAKSPNRSPIRQRLYIGEDNLVHRVVSIQMNGQYVEDDVLIYNRAGARMTRASFAYSPPPWTRIFAPSPSRALARGSSALERAPNPG